jgi:UDP-2,3-diacylglucosamine hydrolase
VSTTHEVHAPADWRRIDFISDLHLAEDTPNAFAAWREYLLATDADAVFILGDLFEAWVGDDARHEGFEARGAAVLAEAALRTKLFFMVGNRDFLLGREMLEACGVEGLPDPTVLAAYGERVLLTHGDAWCLGDEPYQRFRTQVRAPAWQAQVLARPLAERRTMARSLRSESERLAAEHTGPWHDIDAPTAIEAMTIHAAPTLVHGHTHRPETAALAPGFMRHVLSDWDLDHATTPPRAEALRWEPGRWTRLAPSAAAGVAR